MEIYCKKTTKAMRVKCTLNRTYSREKCISDMKYKIEKVLAQDNGTRINNWKQYRDKI